MFISSCDQCDHTITTPSMLLQSDFLSLYYITLDIGMLVTSTNMYNDQYRWILARAAEISGLVFQ